MAEVRACSYFLVLFLCFQITIGKPFFGLFWCDLFCDDDDDNVSTTATVSSEDLMDDILCGACEPRRPRITTPNPAAANPFPGGPGFNFVLPPNGMNVTMAQQGAGQPFWMGFLPWGSPQVTAPPAPAVTAAPAVTTAAATTAAAAAAATTAAAAATTAAPTTAAPAGKK